MKHIKTQKELNEASENLNISDVRKQRELLISFLEHLNTNLNLGVNESWVDDFIRFGKRN
jgi:uncharacterized protein with ParB-like and HNH nuclease domain